MNEEIKSRWISKLTSGEYPQTTGALATPDGYCCLGVLCEIAVEDGIVFKRADETSAEYISKLDEEDFNEHVLPDAVVKWAGLESTNPDVEFVDNNGVNDSESLAELNDNGATFAEVAQYIEKNL